MRKWTAEWITPEEKVDSNKRNGAGYLRKKFECNIEGKATLYATAHGLYKISLNEQEITNDIFTPGCDEYDKRLGYQSYDVTDFLNKGENEIVVTLGDGWYRGCNGIDGTRNVFGDDLSFLCEIVAGSEMVLKSDESFEASMSGPILLCDLELGEIYDSGIEDAFSNESHNAKVITGDYSNLFPTDMPIREHEEFEGNLIETPNGETVFDFTQNLCGYTSIFIKNAKAGDRIKLVHGETLDENGNFTIENFQPGDRNKSGGIKQEIVYICHEGINVYKPSFSLFGFRYAKYEGDIDANDILIKSHAVYSDMKQLSGFECGNQDVNRLFLNSLWSMKSNFVDIPTDCPTRERAGWSGDAEVFAHTGTYLMDCEAVYKKWLKNVRKSQLNDGRLLSITPRNGNPGKIADMFSGSVGWGDAAVIVPWELYIKTGDKTILEDNYEMMVKWVSFLEKRASKSRIRNKLKRVPYKKYIIDTGMDYGEWCEPGANVMKTMSEAFMNGQPEVATAYLAYSAKLLSQAAKVLGRVDDEKKYGNLYEKVKEAYRYLRVKNGHIETNRQCELVRPIAFDLLSDEEKKTAAEDLNRLIQTDDYHLNTGFLSTQYLCPVLCEYGYSDTAYRLLLQDTYPSWLYAVRKGATTIWETWDGIREDGSVHDSLNHYSYGVISGWLIEGVLGIQYTFDCVIIRPQPNKELGFAKGYYDSPMGRIVSEWSYDNDKINYHIEIPDDVEAKIILPGKEDRIVNGGMYDYSVTYNRDIRE